MSTSHGDLLRGAPSGRICQRIIQPLRAGREAHVGEQRSRTAGSLPFDARSWRLGFVTLDVCFQVCIPCPPNEYSFSSSASCLPCPARVECAGGDAFVAHEGYWRQGNGTEVEKCRC